MGSGLGETKYHSDGRPDLGEIVLFLQVPTSRGWGAPLASWQGWVGQGHLEPPWGAGLGDLSSIKQGDSKAAAEEITLSSHSDTATAITPQPDTTPDLWLHSCAQDALTPYGLRAHWFPADVPPVKPPRPPIPADSTHFWIWCSQSLTHRQFFFLGDWGKGVWWGRIVLTWSEIFKRNRHKSLHIFPSVRLGRGSPQREGMLHMDFNLCKVEWTQLSSLQYIIYQRSSSSIFAHGIPQIVVGVFFHSPSLFKHSWGFYIYICIYV